MTVIVPICVLRSKINAVIYSLLCIFLIAESAFGQSSSNEFTLTQEEQIWVSENPVITATNTVHWAPLDFVQGGEPAGFSIDYLNLIASKVGLTFEFVNGYTFDELMTMVRDREIDITHGISITEDRQGYLNFTDSYLELPTAYFGRTGSEKVNSLDDLRGKRIGVIKGYLREQLYGDLFPDLQTVSYDTSKDALLGLSAGDIDVFADNLPVARYLISKHFITDVEVIGGEFLPELNEDNQLRIAVRNDWPVLYSVLQKGMLAVSDREYIELANKWQARYRESNLDIGLSDDEIEWLSNNPVIKVALDQYLAPFEIVDKDGSISGIVGDYFKIFSERLNVEFEWVGNENFSEGLEMVRTGEADVVAHVTPTVDRRKYLEFTDTFLTPSIVIFAREGEQVFGNLGAMAGYSAAMPR
ncbi:transporter substrate-binding domain-containing protein [Pseudemcibacter aquimaris]|uniref:transporter substrate-binding domain-containing protein n=1 Tax=Pseudemcibacter aquimaris TaxID=2857064 RepID=UPI002012DE47|nr:transporter substrate-binding domain-containing protein [Pseudemcibacter aquimaris]MCC3860970.1 transporter substrate-binding domain-containing protein [Pseudemcibacter aquimaris]WDU59788.1 transporter substrate-binding domain-containing protein [Pseudemcibacter aquimaris]